MGTYSFSVKSGEMVRSLCVVPIPLPVCANFRSIIFSSAVLVQPEPAMLVEKTLKRFYRFTPVLAVST